MKKIYLFILLLVFIFSEKSLGQIEPRLAEKKYEYYAQGAFNLRTHQFYKYDESGNTLSIIEKIYDYHTGELNSWLGDFFEYDDEFRLIKKINRRHNSEVDLWISNYWVEYFYDENNCIEREELTYNVGGSQGSWYFFTDGNCRKIESRRTNESDYNYYKEYIYPDENNSLITIEYTFSNNVWNENYKTQWIRNEKGDITTIEHLLRNGTNFPQDTGYYFIELYEYDYSENSFTGQVSSKFQKYYNNNLSIFGDSFFYDIELQTERRFDYEYYCDGELFKETESVADSSRPLFRTSYFYEGKNDCFDFEQDLEMMISPNPSFGEIEIKSLIFDTGNTDLQVFTTNGQMVFEKSISSRSYSQNVDLSFLENGVYVIHLRSGKHFSTSKLVMAR